jgi:hypothetical protein
MKSYTVAVGGKEQCTDSLCRSKFYDCPDYGSHNADGGIVTASYHDCTCSCCKEGTCGSGLKEYTFEAGAPEKCNAQQCSSQFYSCPDPGAHNAVGGCHSLSVGTHSRGVLDSVMYGPTVLAVNN